MAVGGTKTRGRIFIVNLKMFKQNLELFVAKHPHNIGPSGSVAINGGDKHSLVLFAQSQKGPKDGHRFSVTKLAI